MSFRNGGGGVLYGAQFSGLQYEQQRIEAAAARRARQRGQARALAPLRAFTVEIAHGAGRVLFDIEAPSAEAARTAAYRLYGEMTPEQRDARATPGASPIGSVKQRLIGTTARALGLGFDLDAKQLVRAATATVSTEGARSVGLTFSSEARVPRSFGIEILSHQPGAADLSRLTSGAPLLFNHNMDDVIGVVETAAIGADRRGHATVRFAKTARGTEVLDMVKDRILRNVSFMYSIDDIDDSRAGEYLITKWQPLEISIVTVPADGSVGVGRTA